jgi:hypothetical protein
MADPNGEFYAELKVVPTEMFDSLMIEGAWTNVSASLGVVGTQRELMTAAARLIMAEKL